MNGLTRRLIQHAARRAPPSLAERLEEEWLADLEERRGAMSRLRLALGCCWATMVIAYEHPAASVAATSTLAGQKTALLYARYEPSLVSPRATVLLLIVGLHVVAIYALATGLMQRVVEAIPPPMQAGITKDTRPPAVPPPLPRPALVPSRIEPVEPELGLQFPPSEGLVFQQPAQPVPPLEPSRGVNRVVGGPGKGFPNTDDYYPSASRRIGEKGSATVRVCIDGNGRLTAEPTLAQSSGSSRLDEGALTLAKAGSGHYRASTEDGRPVSSCFPFRIRFELRD